MVLFCTVVQGGGVAEKFHIQLLYMCCSDMQIIPFPAKACPCEKNTNKNKKINPVVDY